MSRGAQQEAKQQLNQTNQYAAGANQQAGNIFNTLFPELQANASNPGASNPELASAGSQYQKEINNPMGLSDIEGLPTTSGYTPDQVNAMTTASNQSLGGGVGGAVGQGNLTAARTRNAGGYATALDDAVRSAGRQQSQNALGVQEDSAKLSAQQQQDNANLMAQQRATDAQLKSSNLNAGLSGLENNAMGLAGIQQNALSGMEGLYGQNINELMSMMGLGPNEINAETNAGNSGWLQNTLGTIGALGQLGSGIGGAATGISKL
jgi:hypothetical protein